MANKPKVGESQQKNKGKGTKTRKKDLQKWLVIATLVLAVASLASTCITAVIASFTVKTLESSLLYTKWQYFRERLDNHHDIYLTYLSRLASTEIDNVQSASGENFCDQPTPEKKDFCLKYNEYVKTWSNADTICKCCLDYLTEQNFDCVRANLCVLQQQICTLNCLYEEARVAYYRATVPVPVPVPEPK